MEKSLVPDEFAVPAIYKTKDFSMRKLRTIELFIANMKRIICENNIT